MSHLPPRMPPVTPDRWTDEVHEFYALLDPKATRETGSRWRSLQIMANLQRGDQGETERQSG